MRRLNQKMASSRKAPWKDTQSRGDHRGRRLRTLAVWIAGDRATLADLWVPSGDPRSAAPATPGTGRKDKFLSPAPGLQSWPCGGGAGNPDAHSSARAPAVVNTAMFEMASQSPLPAGVTQGYSQPGRIPGVAQPRGVGGRLSQPGSVSGALHPTRDRFQPPKRLPALPLKTASPRWDLVDALDVRASWVWGLPPKPLREETP